MPLPDNCPPDLPNLPTYRKDKSRRNGHSGFDCFLGHAYQGPLYDLCDSFLAQKISQVDGVGLVRLSGGSKPAVRVDLNPNALTHYGIGLEEVNAALAAANANTPKGGWRIESNRWILSDTDQLFKPEEYSPLIVAYRNGAPVRIRDIAKVTEGIEDHSQLWICKRRNGRVHGHWQAARRQHHRDSGQNHGVAPGIEGVHSAHGQLDTNYNRTTTIRASVKDIEFTLLLTVALVVMVIFLFLRNAWATIIPSIAVPLSIVGTFGVMYLLHYNLDNLSLMALAICTGFVVDDAIVVIENITRYLEEGLSPMEAAMKGSREIGFTVLSMSTSLIAVFIPLLLMGGIIGRLFREFAVTLSAAIIVSLCVSLTTTPMMCAQFLKSQKEIKHGKVYQAIERVFHMERGDLCAPDCAGFCATSLSWSP